MNQVISQLQDLTYLNWTKTRRSSGTAGSFLKAYEEGPEGKLYYKLSNYDSFKGIVGHECVNEIIVDRLLTVLGVEHLSYQLINARIILEETELQTFLCRSKDFKKRGESKIALETLYQLERKPNETPLEFCIRYGWEKTIYEMIIVDYLILNWDRHGANIEVLRNPKEETLRLAPLFDHGLSLFFSCHSEEELLKENVLADKPVQSFVGSRSAYENLKLIPKEKHPNLNPLRETDKEYLMKDLDIVLSDAWQDKIWEMIFTRWRVYEDLRNQGWKHLASENAGISFLL